MDTFFARRSHGGPRGGQAAPGTTAAATAAPAGAAGTQQPHRHHSPAKAAGSTTPRGGSHMIPAGVHTGARHHNQHHNIFGGSPQGKGTVRRGSPGGPASPGTPRQAGNGHSNGQPFVPQVIIREQPREGRGGGGGGGVSSPLSPGAPPTRVVEHRAHHAAPAPRTTLLHSHGAAEEQGRRPTMEDSHEAHPNIAEHVSLYFVCDGHSGRAIADLAAKLIPSAIRDADPRKLLSNPAGVLTDTFVSVDRSMFKMQSRMRGREGGAACVAAMTVRNDLYLANLGDSRAVLSENGTAIQLTRDHKPTDAAEAQRVRDMGGCIAWGRVGGCLAITRAFGDYELKGGEKVLMEGAPLPVSNVPEISHITLSTASEFLILACDGVWDVLSSQEAVSKCREHMAKGPQKMAQALVAYSLEKHTMDNVSALIVVFSGDHRHHPQHHTHTHTAHTTAPATPGRSGVAGGNGTTQHHAATARANRSPHGPSLATGGAATVPRRRPY